MPQDEWWGESDNDGEVLGDWDSGDGLSGEAAVEAGSVPQADVDADKEKDEEGRIESAYGVAKDVVSKPRAALKLAGTGAFGDGAMDRAEAFNKTSLGGKLKTAGGGASVVSVGVEGYQLPGNLREGDYLGAAGNLANIAATIASTANPTVGVAVTTFGVSYEASTVVIYRPMQSQHESVGVTWTDIMVGHDGRSGLFGAAMCSIYVD
jgi:hypothetical protein